MDKNEFLISGKVTGPNSSSLQNGALCEFLEFYRFIFPEKW